MATNAKILKVLALNEDFAQYDLPSKVDRKYRQIIRCLHTLRDKHLIYLIRTEQSQKGGKEKNFWKITFYGLIEILFLLTDKEIDLVAQRHCDKWLIFQEWAFLLRKYGNVRALLYSKVRMLSRHFNFLEGESLPLFSEHVIKQVGLTPEEWRKYQSELRLFVLEEIKQECTDKVLGLGSLFGSGDSSFFRFLLDKRPKEKWMLLKRARLRCRSLLDNPRIREYIDRRFEQEKTVHRLVEEIEAQWEKTKKSAHAR